MTYILGTKIKDNKKLIIALQQLYGISNAKATDICNKFGLNKSTTLSKLPTVFIQEILIKFLESNYLLTTKLRTKIRADVDKYIQIKCYRGIRLRSGLPVRGQRTHTNRKTVKKLYRRYLPVLKKKSIIKKKKL
jgi:small subunit ribosomal protein S13